MIRGLTTVVIPCYNQAGYLAAAIASALGQDHVELIVVDDGSTDQGAAVAERFPGIIVLRQPNRGVASARNLGAAAARGEFVVFLDADDRLKPGAVAALRRALEADPNAAFAYGTFESVDDAGEQMRTSGPYRRAGRPYESLLRSNYICTPSTVMYRQAAVLDVGGFPAGIDAAADYAMYLQLARRAPAVEVGAVVAEYRAHRSSMSRRADRMLVSTLRAHARERATAATPELRRAWTAGRAHWRQWYGNQLVDQIRAEWRARSVLPFLRDVRVLARYAPGVLLEHALKKIRLAASTYRTRYSTKRASP